MKFKEYNEFTYGESGCFEVIRCSVEEEKNYENILVKGECLPDYIWVKEVAPRGYMFYKIKKVSESVDYNDYLSTQQTRSIETMESNIEIIKRCSLVVAVILIIWAIISLLGILYLFR